MPALLCRGRIVYETVCAASLVCRVCLYRLFSSFFVSNLENATVTGTFKNHKEYDMFGHTNVVIRVKRMRPTSFVRPGIHVHGLF